jgi:HEPN domain-containing protein
MSAEHDIAEQWLTKARSDLLNADNNLAAACVPCDTVCFHCQQAAEKMLKALLAAKGTPPPRTHDLLLLMQVILDHTQSIETLREALIILNPYAVAARYPDETGAVPTLDDAREARQCAEAVLTWLKHELPSS